MWQIDLNLNLGVAMHGWMHLSTILKYLYFYFSVFPFNATLSSASFQSQVLCFLLGCIYFTATVTGYF